MKVLFDTSVLVAALLDSHPNHQKAFEWLSKVKHGKAIGYIGCHTLAELYAVLTSLPFQKTIPTIQIWELIQNSVISMFNIVELTKNDYVQILDSAAQINIRGGTVYDAVIAHAANKAKVDKLLTFNPSHFIRVYPAISKLLEDI